MCPSTEGVRCLSRDEERGSAEKLQEGTDLLSRGRSLMMVVVIKEDERSFSESREQDEGKTKNGMNGQ